MTIRRCSILFALLSTLWLAVTPAWGASKEMIQLQTQVQQLQEQMTAMQRSFDERMGVMKNLVEQDTDAVNKVADALTALQTTLQKQQGDSSTHVDQLSGQIQALNDTLDELKARLAKVSKQLEDMQSSQQSQAAQQAQQQAQQQAAARLLRPMFSTTTRCAITTATRTISPSRNFPTTSSSIPIPISPETATSISAKFNSARETTQQAAQSYDQVLQNFPTGNKTASAQLKKGFSLIELGKQDDGVRNSAM